MKKHLLGAVAAAALSVGWAGAAFAQAAPKLINAPTFNASSFVFGFSQDNGQPVSITLPFATYAPLNSPTFTGNTTVAGLTFSSAIPANLFFGSPSSAAGVPTARAIVAADIPFAAPLASPSFTGTVTAVNLTVTGTLTATGFQGRSEAAVTPATITAPASGSAPSGATVIATPVVYVQTCSATQPLQLPVSPATGTSIEVDVAYYPTNPATAPSCPVYPQSAGTVSGAAANIAATIAPNVTMAFRSISASAWLQ